MKAIPALMRLVSTFLAAAVLCTATQADTSAVGTLAGRIDHAMSARFTPDRPGAAVLAARNGEVILRQGYGLASVELSVPVDPQMNFGLASVTKLFTAVAAMLLVEDGKLRLDDEIVSYLPQLVHARGVTIANLLSHTSGITGPITEVPGYRDENLSREITPEALIESYVEFPLKFPPGERSMYSNEGVATLARIVEIVSGQAWEDFLKERIFVPAGMPSTFYAGHDRIIPKAVTGYTETPNGWTRARYTSFTRGFGMGALFSNVDDLYAFYQALVSGRLIKADTLSAMLTPFKLNDGSVGRHGFGFAIMDWQGHKAAVHGGEHAGWNSFFVFLPDDGIFVTVLTNRTPGERKAMQDALEIVDLMLAEPETFDTLIVNGTLVDGSGAPRVRADVGIRDGRIARIGDLSGSTAANRIDAEGQIVAPGFIDVHTHVEQGLLNPALKENRGYITQGVTTCVIGADGGHAPKTIRRMLEVFEEQGVGTHYGFLVGVNAVRKDVIGMENRAPTPEELERMKGMVREAMELGAFGLSSGLMYLPARYASKEEVVELARIVAEYDGLYDSHVRNAVPDFEGAYRENIEIGIESGARPHPAHYKAVAKRNWGRAKALNDWFQQQIDQGIDITVDAYPYDGAATAQLVDVFAVPPEASLPVTPEQLRDPTLDPEVRSDLIDTYVRELTAALADPVRREAIRVATEVGVPGVYSAIATAAEGYDALRIVVSDKFPELEGKMLIDIAEERGVPPFQVMVDLLNAEGAVTKVSLAAAIEDEVREIMRRPWAMIASDGSITGFEHGRGHPRSRGTFPRVLGRYVREWNVVTLEDAIYKMTWLPASYYRIAERGLLREGFRADITVFDPDTVIDRSTWREPTLFSEGIVHVLVDGTPALKDGQMTGALAGTFVPRADKARVFVPAAPTAVAAR